MATTTIYGAFQGSAKNWRSYLTYEIVTTSQYVNVNIYGAGINCDGGWTNFTSTNTLSILVDGVDFGQSPYTKTVSGKINQYNSKNCVDIPSGQSYLQIQVPKTSSEQTLVIKNKHTHSSYSSTATTNSITIPIGFEPPSITNVQCYRCDSSGQPDSSSESVKVACEVVGGLNYSMDSSIYPIVTISPEGLTPFSDKMTQESGSTIKYSIIFESIPNVQPGVPLDKSAQVTISINVTNTLDPQSAPVSIVSYDFISTENYILDATSMSLAIGAQARDNVSTFSFDMGSQDNNINIYVNGFPLVDYIIEQDTETITDTDRSGNWNYRKWASGKLEAWGSITFASVSFGNTMEGNLRRSDPESVPIPSVVNSIDIIQGTADTTSGSGYGTVWRILATASPPTMIFVKSASGASDIVCSLYLIGTWS